MADLRLYLLRHAKSDWSDPAQDDHDRVLNERGRKAAQRLARYIRDEKIHPDLVLCSTAARTRETLSYLQKAVPRSTKIRFEDDLYLAEPDGILALVRATPVAYVSLMVIGHNPGLQQLTTELADRAFVDKFPTGALAELAFKSTEWAKIGTDRGSLLRYVTPRGLENQV